ncbi:MAG: hypothetical protein ACKOWF_13485 [Chloroflexota bacterium]
MDTARFERLARQLAGTRSRRDAARVLAAALAAALPGAASAAGPNPEGIPIISCKIPGELCQGDQACCSGHCKQGICTCVRRGRRCWTPAEGVLCCSGRCHSGKCR